jgi:hypothetical protein
MHTELVVIYTLFRSQLEKLSLLVLANPDNNIENVLSGD